jgi:NADP-dependent alcohol dehydrogenase
MKNFEFHNPVKIIFGKDQIEKLSDELVPYKKILFAYGQGSIKKNSVYQQVINQLSNYDYVEFPGIEPNPVYETLMKAVDICRSEDVDFILAVGGGSVIDGAKFIAAAAKYEEDDPWEILAKQKEVKDAVKLGSILTLPATGSEMNGTSVVSRKSNNEKLAFGSPLLMPVFSILDPQINYSLPDNQIANGIIDAYVHVMEQYLTFPFDALVQDKYSESLLKILIDIGPKILKNRTDYQLNANLTWTATMALNGLLSTGVLADWSTHMIGHEITAEYGLDHAETLAIVLPGVMKIMQEDKHDKILQYAKNVFNLSGNDKDMIELAIQKTEHFFNSLGVRTKLSDYNIDESVLHIIPERLQRKRYIKLGEKKNINPDLVREILKDRL